MALALLLIAVVLLVSAVKGTHSQLAALVKGDFTGPNNFIYWIVAIATIGAVGYVEKLKPISDGLIALVIVVLTLNEGSGFFTNFTTALSSTTSTTTAPAVTTNPATGLSTLPSLTSFSGNQTPSVSNASQTLALPVLPNLTTLLQ